MIDQDCKRGSIIFLVAELASHATRLANYCSASTEECSRSHRIVWLLEEIGIPYEIKKYQRSPALFAPKELRDIHPLGKSPLVTDGDVVVAETGLADCNLKEA